MSFIGESKFLIGATVFHLVALPGAAAMAPAPSRPGMAVMVGPSEISVDVDSALLPPDPEQPVPRDVPLGPGDPLAYADPDAVAVRNYDPTRPIRPGATPRDDVEPATTAPYDPGEVITALEERLPVSPYKDEWAILDVDGDGKRHKPFHKTEVLVPIVFMCVHGAQLLAEVPWHAIMAFLRNAT